MPKLAPLQPDDPPRLGPYRLLGRLGRGGMGEVFLAEGQDHAQVAVKVIRPEWGDREAFRARFRREVTAARQVPGLWTARVLDFGLDDARHYLVTEYVEGERLDEVIARQGALSGTALERFAFEVAAALTAIHAVAVVHRDLKPSNVLLSPEGIRVIDFGIARALEGASAITTSGAVLGTPGWMAPEQRRGEPVTAAADVFVWGLLVCCAATGRPPNEETALGAAGPAAAWEALSDPLRVLVRAALEAEPSRRPRAKAITLELLGTGVSDPGVAVTERLRAMTTPGSSATQPLQPAPGVPPVPVRRDPPRAVRGTRRGSDGVLVGVAVLLLAGLVVVYQLAWGGLADVVTSVVGVAVLLIAAAAVASWPSPRAQRSRLPADLQRALRGSVRQRAAVVPQLVELRASNQDGLAGAADVALEQLARDNHRRVRAAASQALRGAPPVPRWERSSPDAAGRMAALAERLWDGLRERAWPPRGRAASADPVGCVAEFDHPAPVVSVAVDAEGRRVVTRSADHLLRVWSARGGDPLVQLPLSETTAVGASTIAVSADGTWVSAAGETTVRVWSMVSGSQTDQFDHGAPSRAIAFSRDGLRLVAASVEEHRRPVVMARAWELSSPNQHRLVRTEGMLPWTRPFALAVSPDGSRLAVVGGLTGAARIWELHNGRRIGLLWPVRMKGNRALPLAFNGNASLLAVVGRRGRLVRIWDVDACQVIRRFRTPSRVRSLAFRADGWRLAVGGDKSVQVWDLDADGEVARIWHGGDVTGLAFSEDGSLLVTGGQDSIARVWRFTGRPHSGA